jgi:methionine synthase II (cobalamin-independent)
VRPFEETAGVRRTVHFCLGDMGRRPATQEQHLRNLSPLIQLLEGQIDRVHLECSYTGQWQERALLAEIPESMEVIAGIADVKAKPESADAYREKIAALLAVLPAERLLVSSSCGCGRVPHDEAIRLMRHLVEAARSL